MSLPFQIAIPQSALLADFQFGLFVLQILLFLTSLFLMLLVLVQRGKGGGLTGALGGSGGGSAFGAKAGDAFTKITIITAAVWIFLCMITIAAYNRPPVPIKTADDDATISAPSGSETDPTAPAADAENGEAAPATEGQPDTTEPSTPTSNENAFPLTPSSTPTDAGAAAATDPPVEAVPATGGEPAGAGNSPGNN